MTAVEQGHAGWRRHGFERLSLAAIAAIAVFYCLATMFPVLFRGDPAPRIFVVTACAVASIVLLLWIVRRQFSGRTLRGTVVLIVLEAALALLSTLVALEVGTTPSVVYFSWALLLSLPTGWAWATYLVMAAVDVARDYVAWIDDPLAVFVQLGMALLIFGVALRCLLRLAEIGGELEETHRELAEAQEDVKRLAAVEERNLMARELHDILGNRYAGMVSLSALVRRLAISAPDQVPAHAEELHQQAVEAAQDMRRVTHGLHRPDFERDLTRCVRMLESEGVSCSLGIEAPPQGAGVEQMGWALLVATNNILRHSDASECAIGVVRDDGWQHLSVENDGVTRPPGELGLGLSGLERRFREAGGRVTAGVVAEGRFRLVAALPEDGEDR